MWWAWGPALLAFAWTAAAMTAEAGDRLDQFRELAGRYVEATDPEADARSLSALFEIVDAEVSENLASGPPFSSVAFIQERLDAFGSAWGGATFEVVRGVAGTHEPALLALFTATRGEPRGSLRYYGRANGRPALLAGVTHPGHIEVHEWPGPGQVLASWSGSDAGRGSWPLHLELWRLLPAAPSRIWSSADAFPGGLRATEFTARNGQLVVRYELQYPGWKPGCPGETQYEDVYRQPAPGRALMLARRRVVNGWHREVQAAVTRLFGALAADDRRTLAALVADPPIRARLPRDLRAEPVCDEQNPAGPATVTVAATSGHDQQRVPWSLSWQRGPRGWRVTAASPVLH